MKDIDDTQHSLSALDNWTAQHEVLPSNNAHNTNNIADSINSLNNANVANVSTYAVSEEARAEINKFTATMYTLRSFKGFTQYLQGKPPTRAQAEELLNITNSVVADTSISDEDMANAIAKALESSLIKYGIVKCRKTRACAVEAIAKQRNIQAGLKERISPREVFMWLEEDIFKGDREDMLFALQDASAIKGEGVAIGIWQYISEFVELKESVGLDALYPSKLNSAKDELLNLSNKVFSADDFDW